MRAAFKRLLEQITTAGGYNFTMQSVYDPPKAFGQMSRFPCCNLLWGDESVEGSAGDFGSTRLAGNNPTYTLRIPVEIDVSLKSNDLVLAQDEILADAQKILGNNWNIPDEYGRARAFDCVYTGHSRWGTDLAKPNGGITIRFDVRYRMNQKDPTKMG